MSDVEGAIRRAEQAAYINHPTAAFKHMHRLAEDVKGLASEVGGLREACEAIVRSEREVVGRDEALDLVFAAIEQKGDS